MEPDPNSCETLSRRLLEIVWSPNYHPKKPKTLMRLLSLDSEDRPMLRKIIRKLVSAGQLSYGANHMVRPGRLRVAINGCDVAAPEETSEKTSGESFPALHKPPDREKPLKHEKHRNSEKENTERKRNGKSPFPDDTGEFFPKHSEHEIVGSFRRSVSGVGFVRPRETRGEDEPLPDVYIAPYLTRDAMTGDLVRVEIFGKKNSGNREKNAKTSLRERKYKGFRPEERGPRGRVTEIIERASRRFVGTYFQKGGWGYVQVDGNVFNQPVEVGDSGAHRAQVGDKVVIEMLRYPTHDHDGEAVLIEVLGPRGIPGLDTLLILREYQLPERFSEAALRAARNQVVAFFDALPENADYTDCNDRDNLSGNDENRECNESYGIGEKNRREIVRQFLRSVDRTDLTETLALTIDPPDAKDFDDAISLQRLENGHWNLGVHIADVSHFVAAGSAIDAEAKDRATSVYLPDRVIPMLPEVLSNSLASLQPHKIRFTITVFMEFTGEGIRCDTKIVNSAIRSAARLNYDEVQEFLETLKDDAKKAEQFESARKQTPECFVFAPEIRALLRRMDELATILRARRMRRGALELNMPDVKIDLDGEGKVVGAHVEIQRQSHRIVEEFMLAANEAVAEFLARNEIPFLRRVHKNPTFRKIKHFADFLRQMKLEDLSADALLESRFLIRDVLDKVAGKPEEAAVDFALLRAMQRAVYTPEEEGHYALASSCYTHFTSPIRRYPDLTVHRALKEHLSGLKSHVDVAELDLLGLHCSRRERRAEDAGRELNRLKLIDYMSRNIGREMDAVINGLGASGIFVLGLEIPAEGLIPLTSLTDDLYRFDRDAGVVSGRRRGNVFRLGDTLRVRVVRADPDVRAIDFQWIKEAKRDE